MSANKRALLVDSSIAVVFILHCLSVFNWYMDDAFISQAYARTLTHSGIFAYSVGDAAHFGISNPLWVFILAPAHFLGLNPYLYEKILGILSGVAAIYLASHYCAALLRQWKFEVSWLRHLPGLILAASWNIACWAVGGLETMFFSMVVAWATLDLVYRINTKRFPWPASMLFGLLVWLRPEGPGLLVLSIAGSAVLFFTWMDKRSAIRASALYAGLGVSHLILKVSVMWLLTGALLPSTYYIKAGHLSMGTVRGGLAYSAEFLMHSGGVFAVCALALPILCLITLLLRRQYAVTASLATMAAMYFAYGLGFIIPVGGDWMMGSRFYVHLIPLIAVTMAVCLAILAQEHKLFRVAALLALALPVSMLIFEMLPTGQKNNRNTGYYLQKAWFQAPRSSPAYPQAEYQMVEFLNNRYSSDHVMAMTEGGFFPYHFHGRYFDLHGWSRRELAMMRYESRRWDSPQFVETLLGYAPEIILISGYRGDDLPTAQRLPIERALMKNKRFHSNYRLMKVFDGIDEIYRYPYEPGTGRLLSYFIYERISGASGYR